MKRKLALTASAFTLLSLISIAINAAPAFAVLAAPQTSIANVATVKFNTTIQAWSLGNSHLHSNNQNMRLRRAELKLSGNVADSGRYFLMMDPARLVTLHGAKPAPRSSVIQDLGAALAFAPGWELTAGQLKAPTTAEGLDSAADLPLPERSLMGRTFGDRREIGAKVGYKTAMWNAASMISTGHTVSAEQFDKLNDLHCRAEWTAIKNVALGGFVTLGDFEYQARGRWGLNSRTRLGKSDLRAEYAQGRDGAAQTHGTTTEAGYWISQNLEPVARFETFSTSAAPKNTAMAETVGVNYLFRDFNTKLQVAGTAMQNMSAPQGTPTFAKDAKNQVVTIALQATL